KTGAFNRSATPPGARLKVLQTSPARSLPAGLADYAANRAWLRALRLAASCSRSFGGAVVTSESRQTRSDAVLTVLQHGCEGA
ncbi:MAG: hypothetical protein ACRDK4_12910, partial [Solirubrobacteraceae bacterium]